MTEIEEAIEWFKSHKGDGWHHNEKGLVLADRIASLEAAIRAGENLLRCFHSPSKPCRNKCDACDWYAKVTAATEAE